MTDALLALPSHLRKRLADALDCGTLPVPPSAVAVSSITGQKDGAESIAVAVTALGEMGLTGTGCASWMRTIDAAVGSIPRADFVWSGPEVPGVHARDTRRVVEELISNARRNIWVSTYAFFDGPKAFGSLARRMDAVPDLTIKLLLNVQRKRGDTSTSESVVRRFADRFWKTDWPGTRRPQVFYDPRAIEPDQPGGVLHAKAIVVDDEAVFITSANFTEAALDRNIEMGLVVRDRALALTVTSHFRTLVDRKLLWALPER